MQSHELLREVFPKTSAKQVPADLGLALSAGPWLKPTPHPQIQTQTKTHEQIPR
jgi:hypothetical protein